VRVNRKVVFPLLALLILGAAARISAQGTAFFYQGRLNDGGSPATNVYDLRFALYDASTNGNLISTPQTNFAVAVNNGLFSTNVDFGAVFTGTNYWLSLGVRTNAGVALNTNTFTLLWPRQPLLPVPYAIFANSASNVIGTLSATQLTGTLPSAQVMGNYFGAVNFTNSSDTYLGTFNGNGLNLTNLNGSNIAAGTVADARLSTNVALLNTNQVFSGVNVFNNATNSFTGSFFGNGLVGFIAVPSNSIQAVRDTGYLLQSSNLTTVTLPASSNLLTGDIVRITGAGSGGWIVGQNTNQSIIGSFLNVSNSNWLEADNAGSAGWVALASSVNGQVLVAAGNTGASGEIYYSQDGGLTWNESTTSFGSAPVSLASSANGSLMIGAVYGSSGGLFISTNFGSTWAATLGSTTWRSVASSYNGLKLAAAVYGGDIYTSTNGGNTWSAGPTSGNWTSVASSADGNKLAAVVTGSKVYTSTNSGSSWTPQSGSPAAFAVASSADGVKLAAVVNGGGIWTSGNSGITWQQQTNAPTANWYSISSSASGGQLIAAANGFTVYVSGNYGATWSKQPLPAQNWQAVTCSGDGSLMTAGGYLSTSTAGSIYYWQPALQYTSSTIGTNGSITGPQGSAVELQYIGNSQFMPISGNGAFWAN